MADRRKPGPSPNLKLTEGVFTPARKRAIGTTRRSCPTPGRVQLYDPAQRGETATKGARLCPQDQPQRPRTCPDAGLNRTARGVPTRCGSQSRAPDRESVTRSSFARHEARGRFIKTRQSTCCGSESRAPQDRRDQHLECGGKRSATPLWTMRSSRASASRLVRLGEEPKRLRRCASNMRPCCTSPHAQPCINGSGTILAGRSAETVRTTSSVPISLCSRRT